MEFKWPITYIIIIVITILLFLFSKAILFSLLFMFIIWFYPIIKPKLRINLLFMRFITIDFLAFASIIMGYFYGPIFGIFIPLIMGIFQTIHEEWFGLGFHGSYIASSMITGLLASALTGLNFGIAGLILIISRYILIQYPIDYLRGSFAFFNVPSHIFNIFFFGALFTNWDKEIITIFKK